MQKICKVCGRTSGGLVLPPGTHVLEYLDWASDELCLACSGLGYKPPAADIIEAPKRKPSYIGAPACFALEQAIRHVCEAFDSYGCYLVGSALTRQDWRDVDIRMIMRDDIFVNNFPNAGDHWEHDEKWLLLTVAISQWLSKQSGLPIDFQFQPQTHANKRHPGARNAIGIKIANTATE